MNQYTTNAINIRSYNLSEADKIVVMYSKEQGIIRCVAKGIKKTNSKLGGRMDLLIANKLLLSKGRNLDIICQAEGVDNFKELRQDITKLSYAIYCAELIEHFGMENDSNSEKIYSLFFNLLKNMSSAQGDNVVIILVLNFQLKLMEYTGYAVELDNCVRCNDRINDEMFVFCHESGGIVCSSCKRQLYRHTQFTPEMRSLLHEAQCFDTTSLRGGLQPDTFTMLLCFNVLKNYIAERSHKKFKSADMIESLCRV